MKQLHPSLVTGLATSSLALLASVSLGGTATAQTQWINFPAATSPSARAGGDLVSTQNGALLFGGQTSNSTSSYLDETWVFDRNLLTWNQPTLSVSPPRRASFDMAYDPARDRVVLFGGWNGGLYLDDTWEWDGTQWTQMTPTTVPEERDWHGMAYDPNTQRVIMFGGHNLNRWPAGPNTVGDMWSWDGTDWTQLNPANLPFMRFGHEMTLDTNRNRIVMWGGTSRQSSAVGAVQHFETWEWDGNDWTQITTTNQPSANAFTGMAYDPRRERMVVYGGIVGGAGIGDVFEYDGSDWTQRTLVGTPVAVGHTDGCYEPAFGRVMNFGGATTGNRANTLASTDIYGSVNDASTSAFGAGCAGSAGTPALGSETLAWLGGNLDVQLSQGPALSPASIIVGFSATQTSGGLSLPFQLAAVGMPGCSLYTDPMLALPVVTDASGNAALGFAVPADPNLIGADIYSQALCIDAPANAPGLTTSNGVGHRIGDR